MEKNNVILTAFSDTKKSGAVISEHGTYKVQLFYLELVKSEKTGDPVVVCWMEVKNGPRKGEMLRMSCPVTNMKQILTVNSFLHDLCKAGDLIDNVRFDSYRQYWGLIHRIGVLLDPDEVYDFEYGDSSGIDGCTIKRAA